MDRTVAWLCKRLAQRGRLARDSWQNSQEEAHFLIVDVHYLETKCHWLIISAWLRRFWALNFQNCRSILQNPKLLTIKTKSQSQSRWENESKIYSGSKTKNGRTMRRKLTKWSSGRSSSVFLQSSRAQARFFSIHCSFGNVAAAADRRQSPRWIDWNGLVCPRYGSGRCRSTGCHLKTGSSSDYHHHPAGHDWICWIGFRCYSWILFAAVVGWSCRLCCRHRSFGWTHWSSGKKINFLWVP